LGVPPEATLEQISKGNQLRVASGVGLSALALFYLANFTADFSPIDGEIKKELRQKRLYPSRGDVFYFLG
jgi:hypothetical protein